MSDHGLAKTGDMLLERYRVTGVLGRSGIGMVYDAIDTRLSRPVAIKALQPVGRGPLSTLGPRFEREAQTVATLNHPNLVTLLDYDLLDDGTPAMVMERVTGRSVRDLLPVHAFTAPQVTAILTQTLSALEICHDRSIVHRDLKPGNVLLHNDGDQGLGVKIVDFGLTKLVADEGATALTLNGQVFGSPRFMAPEQWLRGQIDGRTDLYALGLIGYCMVHGDHFIALGNPVDVCQAHLYSPRPAFRTMRDGTPVPPILAQVLARAAAPQIDARFEDAREMKEALAPLARALPQPAPMIAIQQARRSPGRAAGAAVVLGAMRPIRAVQRPAGDQSRPGATPPIREVGLNSQEASDLYADESDETDLEGMAPPDLDDDCDTEEIQAFIETGDETFKLDAPFFVEEAFKQSDGPFAEEPFESPASPASNASAGAQPLGRTLIDPPPETPARTSSAPFGVQGAPLTAVTHRDVERALSVDSPIAQLNDPSTPLALKAPVAGHLPPDTTPGSVRHARTLQDASKDEGRSLIWIGLLGGFALVVAAAVVIALLR